MAEAFDAAAARGEHDGATEGSNVCVDGKATVHGLQECMRYVRSVCSDLVKGDLTDKDIAEHYARGFQVSRDRAAKRKERAARTEQLYDLAEDLGEKDHEAGRAPTPARVREVVTYCRTTIPDTDASDRVIGERYADGYAPPVAPPAASPDVQPGGET